jgi:hypothetical protein
MREFRDGDWVVGRGLIADLDLSLEVTVARPLEMKSGTDQRTD